MLSNHRKIPTRGMKEATARIKINKLLEAAGWRFFADAKGPANIQLEPKVTLKTQDLDALGANFEKSSKGFIDFLLLNEKSFPFIVLEAKAEDKRGLYVETHSLRFLHKAWHAFGLCSAPYTPCHPTSHRSGDRGGAGAGGGELGTDHPHGSQNPSHPRPCVGGGELAA
jgi:hypothetical protein